MGEQERRFGATPMSLESNMKRNIFSASLSVPIYSSICGQLYEFFGQSVRLGKQMNLFAYFIATLSAANTCPTGCRCEFVRQRVFCHNRGLVRIPMNIPTTTKMLYLQDNLLSSSVLLDNELSRLTQLTRLMLYNNNLTRIPSVASVHLRQLKIDRNKINKLPENVLGHG